MVIFEILVSSPGWGRGTRYYKNDVAARSKNQKKYTKGRKLLMFDWVENLAMIAFIGFFMIIDKVMSVLV